MKQPTCSWHLEGRPPLREAMNTYNEVILALKDYDRAKQRVENAQQRLDASQALHIHDNRDEQELADAKRAFEALGKAELADRLDELFG